jgi:hypothetical protein
MKIPANLYNKMLDEMNDAVDEACIAAGHKKVRVFYSAYKTKTVNNEDIPINNLGKVAIKGKCVLFSDKDEFYGGPKSKRYLSEWLENPTWLQIAVCANTMIRITRDEHHVFLEGVTKADKSVVSKFDDEYKSVPVYEFIMGS